MTARVGVSSVPTGAENSPGFAVASDGASAIRAIGFERGEDFKSLGDEFLHWEGKIGFGRVANHMQQFPDAQNNPKSEEGGEDKEGDYTFAEFATEF